MCGGAGAGKGAPKPKVPKGKRPPCMTTSSGGNRTWTSSQDKSYFPGRYQSHVGGGKGYSGGGSASGKALQITGSRTYTNRAEMRAAIIKANPSRIIHGGAKGADSMAESLGKELGIPTQVYPLDWSFGRASGFQRNSTMLWENPNATLNAFFGGRITGGTGDTVGKALLQGRTVTPSLNIFGISAAQLAAQGFRSVAGALSRFLSGW